MSPWLLLILFAVLLLLMLLGISTGASMGITAIVFLLLYGDASELVTLAQRMYAGCTNLTLLAIPFYILMGNLMNESGVSSKLYKFARVMVGHLWGGLAHADILTCTVMAGMSGSAVAEAASIGMIAIPEMEKAGYENKFSAAITAAAATLGPVIPPSIAFVIYATLSGASTASLFMAGVIPGIFTAVALMIAAAFISRKRGYQRLPKTSWKQRWTAFKEAFLSLMTVVIILIGITTGWFTVTEAAVIAALWAAFLGFFVYRTIKIRDIPRILWATTNSSCTVMMIMGIASFFSYVLQKLRVPENALKAITSVSTNPYIVMTLIIAILLVLGCFIEGTAIYSITCPIFIPLANQMNYSLVVLGVVMVLTCGIGLITPPVGMNLFTVTKIAKEDVWVITKELLPFIVAMLIIIFIMAFFPGITIGFLSLFGMAA